MTKITLENEFGVYTIESKNDCETFIDYWGNLVRPLLIASGFPESLVDDCHNDTVRSLADDNV